MIPRTGLLSFGHRVDEMETIWVPDNRQYRFVVIDPLSCPCSRLIILCRSLPLLIDLTIKPGVVKGDNILTHFVLN
jgi:hypothetical protein